MRDEDILAWKHYLLCGTPGPRVIGNPSSCDIVLAFSFGRNTCADTNLFSIGNFRCRMKRDDLALRGLRKIKARAGQPNHEIAQKMKQIMDGKEVFSFSQWEIPLAIEWNWYLKKRSRITCIWPVQTKFTTFMVAKLMVDLLRNQTFSRPLILAHRDHLARVYLILRKLLGKHVPIAAMAGTEVFDAQSLQPQTTNWESWVRFERLIRVHHVMYRYVI